MIEPNHSPLAAACVLALGLVLSGCGGDIDARMAEVRALQDVGQYEASIAELRPILAIEPNAKGIVSSGYSDDTVMSRYMDYGFRAVLPKPYEPQQLLDLVKEILEE